MLSSSRRRVVKLAQPTSVGIIQRHAPWAMAQQRNIWPLIMGGLVVAGGAAVGHYVARAIRRVKEREAEAKANGTSGDDADAGGASLLNGDVVSLDLGSSSAKIAYRDNLGKVYMLENREGRHATPAAYQFDADSGIVVGQVAKTQRYMKPESVAFGVHQLLGLKTDDEVTKKVLAHVPFKYFDVEGEPAMVGVDLRGTQYSAAQLAEAVARDMYAVAQGKLGSMDGVIGAVSVPLFFNALQTTQYLKACKEAGFQILKPDHVPTDAVAAVSGALQEGLLTAAGDVAVVDIGGRFTQVSIVEVKDDGSHDHQVKAHHTSFEVGSEWIDKLIADKLAADFQRTQKLEITGDGMALQRLYDAAETSKIELSRNAQSEINLPFITADATGPKHLVQGLSRSQMDALIEDMLAKLSVPVQNVVKEAGIAAPKDVKAVLIVGGGARTLKVQDAVAKMFDRKASDCLISETPEELVAIGSAVHTHAQYQS